MTWNYRIIEFPYHFALHEVFYDSKGNVQSYTAEAISFTSDKEDGAGGVVESLSMALADARQRDVLNHADLPKCEGTMASDILAFQAGREAAISGKPRDGRRSADWLEGYDMVMSEGVGG